MKTFDSYRDALFKMYLMGYRNHVIHKKLYSYYLKNPSFVNRSPIFFKSILYASDVTSLQHLINLFEMGRRDQADLITIHKYLNFINENLSIFGDNARKINTLIKFDRKKIKNKEETIGKLLAIRDNVLSHLDKKAVRNFKLFFIDVDLRPRELDTLYSLAKEILNRYSESFDGLKIELESEKEIHDDLEKLLTQIQ